MTWLLSAGVTTTETDLSQGIAQLGTSPAAFAGIFTWGPMFQPTLIGSQKQLANTFGKPSNLNAEGWFSAYNFLDYGGAMWVVRTANVSPVMNASVNNYSNAAFNSVAQIFQYYGTYQNSVSNVQQLQSCVTPNPTVFENQYLANSYPANVVTIGRYPGSLGNSLRFGMVTSNTQFGPTPVSLSGTLSNTAAAGNSYNGLFNIVPGQNVATITWTANGSSNVAAGNTWAQQVLSSFGKGDLLYQVPTGNRSIPFQTMQIKWMSNVVTNTTVSAINVQLVSKYMGSSNYSSNAVFRQWEYAKYFSPPASWTSNYQLRSSANTVQDITLAIVVDELGFITGTPNTVLETYNNLSRSTDAIGPDGNTIYYQTVINQNSQYLFVVNDLLNAFSNTANNLLASSSGAAPFDASLRGGNDGDSEFLAPMQTYINGWEIFQNKRNISVSLIVAGHPTGSSASAGINGKTYNNFGMADWLINNIAAFRKDCVVFFTPDKATTVNNLGQEAVDIVNWASLITPSTYGFMDSGYKYQYDPYNNINRWLPLNGDTAGCAAYTDQVGYPWYSIAGLNRGVIRNVIKLAYNPSEPDSDFFYPLGINPVISEPGLGTYLNGDRTFTQQVTAFNRINVRRLFIVLETSISATAKYFLFEQNDAFTQNQFTNVVNPFLKYVQGARGITAFLVVCNSTNNVPQIVDEEAFLCAIYVKPERSINFIRLDFVSVDDGVDFAEVEQPSL